MKRVSDILDRKGRSIISVTPDAIVIEALKIMSDKNIGSVLVMDGPAYVGLLTERDYARKVILKGKASSDVRVKDIMSTGLHTIQPETSIDICMKVIKAVIANHEHTIQQLENYIHS